ncbi:MAG: glycosyltransferase family 2 protein [Bacteroidales bacterium]|nr:glycosyltransferase family 2 protein [Bacteroidales bacterium]
MSRLLVIVVVFNGMRWLERCLGSVLTSTIKADLFVIDNNSTDGSAGFVEERFPQAILIRREKNLGFARANDLGLKYALENGYDFVYLLNQDAWVMPDTFEKLIGAYSDSDFGIISPLQLRPDMATPDKRFRRHYHGSMEPSAKVNPVRFVMAAHWMISSECLRKTGLFSPAFQHYGEDNNYCDRVRFHGFRIGVLTSAKAVHDRQARKKSKPERIYLNYQYSKVRLSDPNSSFFVQSVWQPIRQCLMALRWLSTLPLRDIPSLIREYPALRKWRVESMAEGAFIQSMEQG